MRHRIETKKFNRSQGARKALLRSLALALIDKGEIETTLPKAKWLRPFIERLLSLSKKGTLASHRLVIARLGNKPLSAKKLREDWVPKFKEIPSGYTRILRLQTKRKDSAKMARISFIVPKEVKPAKNRVLEGKDRAK
mgnify:CR=1 FL=1